MLHELVLGKELGVHMKFEDRHEWRGVGFVLSGFLGRRRVHDYIAMKKHKHLH